MRLRLVFVVVALLCLSPALWAQEQPSCKLANEQYLECGSACPATCANPAPEMCVDMCVAGCFCATGFLRAADGSCVEASTCTTATANGCPPGVEKASCLVDPCFAAKCASSPGAKCTPNYCGGCNAVFTDAASGQVVDCDAAVPDPAVDPNTGCPPGVPTARCFADPCAVNQCPAFPTARCTANYCGGCHAVFTDAVSGQKVDCNAQTTPASDCTYDGKTYKAGESWRPSPCSTCSCDGQTGTSQCAVMDCAPPRCDTPVTKPGQCCPVCEDAGPVCGANEVYFQCAPNCPLRCGEPPAAVCTEQCTPGCGCKPGFLLTKDGRCVEGRDCPGAPPQRVDEHGCVPSAGFAWCQSKSKCLRAWEEDCADVSILPVDEVDANGCLLGAGYVWCEAKTKCIRPWEEKCAPAPFGGSADQHGCVGSAGYQWCEAKQRCHRPWEEDCAPPSIGLGGGGEGCKTHAGYLWCEAKQKCLRPWEEPCSTGAHVLHRRDPQGCVVTAGYLWCEAKQRCVRAWEERCEASANANANASATQPSSQPALRPLLGAVVSTLANRHGCLGHAGYTWCDAKQKCLRLWEEPCEQRTGGTTGSGSGSGCLGSAGYVWCESSAKCLRTWEERCDALLGVVTDGNGCQPSTGMMWCEAKRKCLRPWEEPCEERITPGGGPHLLGGADGKDPNGCIGHAGYIYCASKQKCLRPWEEECPTATTFGGRDENGCAGTAGFTWCQHKGKCVRPWEEECEASAPLHNCHSREVWSQDKQDWCCKNKNIGCSDECSACTGPAPLGASKLCTDGSVAGPVCKRSATGKCGWEMTVCPVIEGPQVCCQAMPACPVGYAAIDSCDATDAQCRNVTMCCTTIFCKAIELPIGGNQDPTNPCAAMGGYTWCAAKSKCLRVWEEACDTPHAVDASTGITSATTSLAGGKRDANGCLASSGHTWCASKGKCLRVWEEDCPLSSCSAATDGTRCDDGDDATVNDHCVAGKCFGRPVRRVGPSIRTVLQMELDQFDANDWLAKLTAHFKLPSADYINIVSVRGGSVTVEHQFVVPADADAAAAAATAEPSTLTTQYLSEATDPSSALSASTLVKSAAPADEELPANVTPGIGYHSGVPAFVGAGGGIFVGVALLAVGVVIARKRLQARKTVSEMANAEALL